MNNNLNKKLILLILLIVIILIAIFLGFRFIKTKQSADINNTANEQKTIENTNDNNINNNIGNTNANSNNDKNHAFLMTIEEVFYTSSGTIATGKIQVGTINLNDSVQILTSNNEIKTTIVTKIEKYKQNLQTATAGDIVGLYLKDIQKNEIKKGEIITNINPANNATNNTNNVSKFDAKVYMLTKDEGGRHTPFLNNYKPYFYFGTTNIKGTITLPKNIEIVNPGDTANITVKLESPAQMKVGTEFSIIDNNRTIGKGTITKIY